VYQFTYVLENTLPPISRAKKKGDKILGRKRKEKGNREIEC
jgi:hypothetical protein